MINIQTAIRQCRIARKLGKISNEEQQAIIRRINPNAEAKEVWAKVHKLLKSIHQDVAPLIQARRQAERELYQIKFVGIDGRTNYRRQAARA